MRTCDHMILDQLRLGARQAKNAPLLYCYIEFAFEEKKLMKTKMSPKESLVNADNGCVVALGAR